MSYLAWIDFDPEERRRAQTLTSHKLTGPSRDFVIGWVEIAARGAPNLESDLQAIDLVHRRERGLKRAKSRLCHDAPLERWSGASGLARLDFRWKTARKHLGDLVDVA